MAAWEDFCYLHPTIMDMAGLLTQYLTEKSPNPDPKTMQEIWREVFKQDWHGDFDLLPKTNLTARTFACIRSREMYDYCFEYFESMDSTPDNGIYFFPAEYEPSATDPHFCRGVHIPKMLAAAMENLWLDQLHCYFQYPVALAYASIAFGTVDLLRYLVAQYRVCVSHLQCFYSSHGFAMDIAAYHNDLDMLEYLHENGSQACSTRAMDNAAIQGHFRIVKWLHEIRRARCTSQGLLGALHHGHLDIVEYLQTHLEIEFPARAIELAAFDGCLDSIKFLCEKRQVQCTTDAMDYAAAHGHLEIVKYLHYHRTEGCTTNAMTRAAANGHFHIVQFLYKNRFEGCTAQAMEEAASNGHLDIVQFLREHGKTGCISMAIMKAAKHGHVHVAKYLYESQFGCKSEEAQDVVSGGLLMLSNVSEVFSMNSSVFCVR